MLSTPRRALAAGVAATVLLVACGDDDEKTPEPGVENQEEVDAGDGAATTEVTPGGGVGTTGGTGADQGNVEPDSPDDTTQDTAQDTDMG